MSNTENCLVLISIPFLAENIWHHFFFFCKNILDRNAITLHKNLAWFWENDCQNPEYITYDKYPYLLPMFILSRLFISNFYKYYVLHRMKGKELFKSVFWYSKKMVYFYVSNLLKCQIRHLVDDLVLLFSQKYLILLFHLLQ